MQQESRAPIAVLMVLGSCTSLQLGAALATPLLGSVGPAATTAGRLLFAALLLLVLTRPRVGGWDRRQWRAVVVFGISMAAMNACFYAAIARIPLGTAVTIEFAGPLVLAAVLSRRARDLACVAAAAVAIVVLGLDGTGTGNGGGLDPIGVAFALAAAAFWAAYILAGKHVGAVVSGQAPLAVGMAVSAVVMAPFGIVAAPAFAAEPFRLLPLVGVALLSSFVPYSLEFRAMRRLPSRVFGILLALEPVVAGLAGWLLLGQELTWVHAAAMAVVVGASVVSTLGARRSERGDEPGYDAGRDTGRDTGPITAEIAVVPSVAGASTAAGPKTDGRAGLSAPAAPASPRVAPASSGHPRTHRQRARPTAPVPADDRRGSR